MPFAPRKRNPAAPPAKGNLSDEEYAQLKELHQKSLAGTPEQAQTLETLSGGEGPAWKRWAWGMISTQIVLLVFFGLYKLATQDTSVNTSALLRVLGATSPSLVQEGEWWRLVTASFLHTSILDYLFNAWFLWSAGRMVEQTLGRNRMLLIYLLTGAIGGLWLSHRGLQDPILSSAAIFGVIGAMIGIYIRYRSAIPAALRGSYLGFVPLLVIYGIIAFVQPGFSFEAIIAGLAGGIVLPGVLPRSGAFAKRRADGSTPSPSFLGTVAIWAFVAVCFGALFVGGDALGGGPSLDEERFEHRDGWSVGIPIGYSAEEDGRGAFMSHPERGIVFLIGYERSLLRSDAEEAIETLSENYGLGRGRREVLRVVQPFAGDLTALLRAETPQRDLTMEFAAQEEILRRRALWIGFEGPPSEVEYGHRALQLLLPSFENGN